MCPPQTAQKVPTLAIDVGQYLPKKLDVKRGDLTEVMLDFLVCLDAQTADLDDIRRGVCFAQQCSGMGMKNYSQKIEKEVSERINRVLR